MENLSKVIMALFTGIDGDNVLKNAGLLEGSDDTMSEPRHMDADLRESELLRCLLKIDKKSTIDQIEMLCQVCQTKWMECNKNCVNLNFHQTDSVFNTLLYFATNCISVIDRDPVCRYSQLLRWHLLTARVTEDLLTTSFLAAQDLQRNTKRRNFDWPAYINHDNREINNILSKPLGELHMHLKGSSYNFDLSWISLMNNIWQMQKCFENAYKGHEYKKKDEHLYEKIRRAAVIRYYLAGGVKLIPLNCTLAQLNDDFNNRDHKRFKDRRRKFKNDYKITDFQELIKDQSVRTKDKILSDFKMPDITDKNKKEEYEKLRSEDIVDYIPVEHYVTEPVENKVLASERRFMYEVFKAIYEDRENKAEDTATLFYAYLLYKNYFRNEIIQLNERTGFDNFASYEEQKTNYMLDEYKSLLYKAAIEGFLQKGEDRYIECRIVPKDTDEDIEKSLSEIARSVNGIYYKHYGFIFHFIKSRDERDHKELYRHYKLRNEIKKKAYAIFNFRNNQQLRNKKDSLVGTVVGLDAANSEIYCRPEVFAQAFRFLRRHDIKINGDNDNAPDDLNITYHVGEDFLDIADGLRAVEEAKLFLNLRTGDRLGHALVLGTDVREYYESRYHAICMRKQVILDDFAWLYHECIRLIGYTPLCGWMQMKFLHYFNDIYNNNQKKGQSIIDSFFKEKDEDDGLLSSNIDDYYLSWLLRGDSPTIGEDLDSANLEKLTTTIDREWAFAGFNHHPLAEAALRNSAARQLFDAYHSNKYYERGNEADELVIPKEYREEWYKLLENIQQDLLGSLERKHIAIECNPSSNYKIGEMTRYADHPIFRFFNDGICTPFPQREIAVSVNTDDQGVFSTSLEREYSLLALALERNPFEGCTNTPRDINNWLDKIREMSIEQKFVK